MARRSEQIPFGCHVITTYDALHERLDNFFAGKKTLLVVLGPPGSGKSQCAEERVKDGESFVLNGKGGEISAPKAFCAAYAHKHENFVLDDPDSLLESPAGRSFISALSNSDVEKTLVYDKAWSGLPDGPIDPRTGKATKITRFVTNSNVLIIANYYTWGTSKEEEKMVDRGDFVWFQPSAEELHRYVSEWFWDQEVFDWIGQRLHLFKPSCRAYVKAWEHKQCNENWKTMLADLYFLSGNILLFKQIQADLKGKSEKVKEAAFIKAGGGVRATYYAIKAKLKEQQVEDNLKAVELPNITLKKKKR